MRRVLHWLREPERIGAPDCAIMHRWTLIESSPEGEGADDAAFRRHREQTLISLPRWLTRDRKLMVHRFLPNTEDRDPHDHPRGFWTLVLRGGYLDLVPCPRCEGRGHRYGIRDMRQPSDLARRDEPCPECGGYKVVLGERMWQGMLRRRGAEHRHITRSGHTGAWTVVLMGPFERPWGFMRGGRWWPFKEYGAAFGFAHSCPSDEEAEGALLKYTDDGVEAQEKPPRPTVKPKPNPDRGRTYT